jgi:hypothetical protein
MELGGGPLGQQVARRRRKAIVQVGEQRLGRQHPEHLLGAVLPVGCSVQVTSGRDAADEAGDEGRLGQPALVVARLLR